MVDEKTVRLGSIRPIVQAQMLANAEDSLFYGNSFTSGALPFRYLNATFLTRSKEGG